MQDLASQLRCVHCLREQYAQAVENVSAGRGVCSWCYQPSRPMTVVEYRTALRRRLDLYIAEGQLMKPESPMPSDTDTFTVVLPMVMRDRIGRFLWRQHLVMQPIDGPRPQVFTVVRRDSSHRPTKEQ